MAPPPRRPAIAVPPHVVQRQTTLAPPPVHWPNRQSAAAQARPGPAQVRPAVAQPAPCPPTLAPPPVVWPQRGTAAVQARPAIAPAPSRIVAPVGPIHRAPAVLQAKFLGVWVNDETKKGFTVDDDETSEINAAEVKGAQSGIAKYSFLRDALILEHIKSNPEEGSGIGSLLMHLVALRAQTAGKARIIVSKPANTAAGYYAKMGFDLEGARQKRRQMFIDAGREADIPAEITVTEIEARTATVLATAGQSAGKTLDPRLEADPHPRPEGRCAARPAGRPSCRACSKRRACPQSCRRSRRRPSATSDWWLPKQLSQPSRNPQATGGDNGSGSGTAGDRGASVPFGAVI